MTTVTFLGASGGTGTTTLAALSLHLLISHGVRLPTVIAEDSAAFDRRFGLALPPAPASAHQLVDGGRYDERKAASALTNGYLVLVGAQSTLGVNALHERVTDVTARFGPGAEPRTVPVINSAFGRRRSSSHDGPVQMRLPYDSALAAGGPLSVAMPHLSARARAALAQRWTRWVLETFALR